MSNPTQRLAGFKYGQKITLSSGQQTIEFSRFLDQLTAIVNFQGRLANPAVQTVGASPWTYTNSSGNDETVIVKGGTVSKIELVRNTIATDCGVTAGMLWLSPNDGLRITYTVAPTVTVVVR